MPPQPRLARLFVASVILAGVANLALWGPRQFTNLPLFLVLLATSALASGLRLRLPLGATSSNLSISYSVDFAALLLLGTAPTMLIAGTSAFLQSIVGHDRPNPGFRAVFNAAALIVTAQAAGSTFTALGGHPGSTDGLGWPIVASAAVYYLVNTSIIAMAVALTNQRGLWSVWHSSFLWTAPSYFVGAGAAVGGVALWTSDQWWLLPLAIAPVYLTYRSHRMYVDRLADERRHRDEVQRLHTEATAALDAARRSEKRYALAAAGSNDGLWDWDLEADTLYCSDRWKAMLGLTAADPVTTFDQWLAHVEEADRPGLAAAIEAHRQSDRALFEHEYRVRHADGSLRWMLCRGIAVRHATGRAVRMAGSQTDISEQRRIRDTLAQAAQQDPLTGLPNRTLFRELVQRVLGRHQRKGAPHYAVFFIDLDGFKQINDTHGHAVGDRFLVSATTHLRAVLRPGDALARLGGDEFAVLAHNLENPEDVQVIANRLLEAVAEPIRVDGRDLRGSASIGIVVGMPTSGSVDALLRDADVAMYRAKAAGRGRYEIFDPAMHASALARLRVHSELRRAVERREFVLYYQPIVDLPSRRIVGLEALLRWNRADGQLALPSEFLAPAEETGVIVPLTYQVLREACHQVAAWQQMFERPLDLSVNISPALFGRPEFLDAVQDALVTSGLLPGTLRVEIPEVVLMERADTVDYHFGRLREMQVAVHLDNFGSGYGSLSALERHPVDALKLDKSFVARIGSGDNVGGAIIKLARGLGMGLVAEGVETDAHAEQLVALECPQAQGYLFSPPLTPGEVTPMLAQEAVATLIAED